VLQFARESLRLQPVVGSLSLSLTASPHHNGQTPLSQHQELFSTYRNPDNETGILGALLTPGDLKGNENFLCQRESQVALVGSFPTTVSVSTTSICLEPAEYGSSLTAKGLIISK
jgi:hypothetical protein